jgi:hypothetical protein
VLLDKHSEDKDICKFMGWRFEEWNSLLKFQ